MNLNDMACSVGEFVRERGWDSLHRPKSLAMSIAIEASEIMEHFQFCDPSEHEIDDEQVYEVSLEMADVLIYLLSLSNALDVDIEASFSEKMAINRRRFPVD